MGHRACAAVSALAAVAIATAVAGPKRAAAHSPSRPLSGTLLVLRGQEAAPVALGGGFLVWEAGGRQTPRPARLMQRDLFTGRVKLVASDVSPAFGVASTDGWIVYGKQVGLSTWLLAVRHDGRRRVTLSRGLIAPIDERRGRVVWAEQMGSRERVVVRTMATGAVWLAASLPRCVQKRCYRIDAVTLADRGVVFDRGAVGPQPSLVLRRRFGSPDLERTVIRGDPQPDLARSAAGAFYYAYDRGWFRWEFGARKPRLAALTASSAPAVLDDERRGLLVLERVGCRARLYLRLASRHVVSIHPPGRVNAITRNVRSACADVVGFDWSTGTLVVAWAMQPKAMEESHSDFGLVGVVTASAVPGG